MGAWGWIVLYLLLFAMLQFLIYRYLRRSEEGSPLPETAPAGERFSHEEQSRPGNGNGRRCPRCGTENETGYRYCHNCISPISG